MPSQYPCMGDRFLAARSFVQKSIRVLYGLLLFSSSADASSDAFCPSDYMNHKTPDFHPERDRKSGGATLIDADASDSFCL